MYRNGLDLGNLLVLEPEAHTVHEITAGVTDHGFGHRVTDLGIQRTALELDGPSCLPFPTADLDLHAVFRVLRSRGKRRLGGIVGRESHVVRVYGCRQAVALAASSPGGTIPGRLPPSTPRFRSFSTPTTLRPS